MNNNRIIWLIAILGGLLLFAVSQVPGYEYFIDEFYYLACSARLDFGYVDHPPLSIFVLKIFTLIFGDSLTSIRCLSALIFAIFIFVTGKISQELTDSVKVQIISVISVSITPIYLMLASFYSMNIIELLLINILILYLIKLFKSKNVYYWYIIGIICGLSLMNKHTAILYIFAFFLGIQFTKHRILFLTKEFFLSLIIAGLICLPNIIWQFSNNFISLEFYRNATIFKNIGTNPLEIIIMQAIVTNPISFIIVIAGLIISFKNNKYNEYKFLFYSLFILFAIMILSGSSRPDRIAAIYPFFIILGWQIINDIKKLKRTIMITLLSVYMIFTIITFPITLPLFSPSFINDYMQSIGFKFKLEKGKEGYVPQLIADRLDWKQFAQKAIKLYNDLPEYEKSRAAIYVINYGQAGAIELYSNYSVPVISSFNNYWIWSKPKLENVETIIAYGEDKDDFDKAFSEVIDSGVKNQTEFGYQGNRTFYICRKAKFNLNKIWDKEKNFR